MFLVFNRIYYKFAICQCIHFFVFPSINHKIRPFSNSPSIKWVLFIYNTYNFMIFFSFFITTLWSYWNLAKNMYMLQGNAQIHSNNYSTDKIRVVSTCIRALIRYYIKEPTVPVVPKLNIINAIWEIIWFTEKKINYKSFDRPRFWMKGCYTCKNNVIKITVDLPKSSRWLKYSHKHVESVT